MGLSSNDNKRTAVVLLSGGLDSMVAGALAVADGYELYALTIDYGQRHRIEIDAARAIAVKIGCARHEVLQLDLTAFGGSALTDDIAVPKNGVEPGIPVTYVPARNLVFLSVALAFAETVGARDLFIGVNAVDYSGYPDCRPEFITSFEETARLATKMGVEDGPFTVHTPLQDMSKAAIAQEAAHLGLDSALSWSCYAPCADGRPCGTCDSCRLRKKGFTEAGLEDGLNYAE